MTSAKSDKKSRAIVNCLTALIWILLCEERLRTGGAPSTHPKMFYLTLAATVFWSISVAINLWRWKQEQNTYVKES